VVTVEQLLPELLEHHHALKMSFDVFLDLLPEASQRDASTRHGLESTPLFPGEGL
jgi:hypothetical protein